MTVISWPSYSPVLKQFLHVGFSLFPLYIYCIIYFFGSLCWMAYAMLDIFTRMVVDYCNLAKDEKPKKLKNWRRLLIHWKWRYFLVVEWIESINQCFGWVLLLVITCFFILMINYSYILLVSVRRCNRGHGDEWSLVGLYSLNLIKSVIYISGIAYLPYKIQREVFIIN